MLFANDKDGRKTYIDDTLNGEYYYCPFCNEKLVCKFGEKRRHHFAHSKNTYCKDSWHYDMSEWHYGWQNKFPKKNQEVIFSRDGKKHRADVCIGNVVIEFQHSNISPEEFCERNNFYHSIGKSIIWVFDATAMFDFNYLDYSNSVESGLLMAIKTRSEIFSNEDIYDTADCVFLYYYSNECDECEWLYQVSWFWNSYGRKRSRIIFGYDACYEPDEFMNVLLGRLCLEKKPNLGTIPYLWRKNRILHEGIFENERGFRVKITGNPVKMYRKYGQLYGYWSRPKGHTFGSESKHVMGMDDNWRLLSFR